MRCLSTVLMLLFLAKLNASERMEVSICGRSNIPRYKLVQAETTASLAFQHIDVEVVWLPCTMPAGHGPGDGAAWFTVRLRNDSLRRYYKDRSLYTMGAAWVSPDGEGYLADVYYPQVEALSHRSQANESALLGYTIVHELGHLLLGPGHSPSGLMSAAWGQKETLAISESWLNFSRPERDRIRARLQEMRGR